MNSSRDAGRQMNFFGIDYPDLVESQERPQEPENGEEKTNHDNSHLSADANGTK